MKVLFAALLLLLPAAPFAAADGAEPYLAFARANAARARPAGGGAGRAAYELALKARRSGLRRTAPDLRAALAEGLNIGFLLGGLTAEKYAVTTLSERRAAAYIERRLLFSGTRTGDFTALLLLPKGRTAGLPAVLGLHGHGENAGTFRDKYHGAVLAASGFAVALPEFRAMDGGPAELDAYAALARSGFTLLGLRVYEALLAADYLSRSGLARPGATALLGHSGGSSVALLAARLGRGLGAAAVDLNLDLLTVFANGTGDAHCETVPALAPYDDQVNDLATLPFPARRFPYGYAGPRTRDALIAFLDAALRRGLGPAARAAARRPAWWSAFPLLAGLREARLRAAAPGSTEGLRATCAALSGGSRREEALAACQAAAQAGGAPGCAAARRAAALLAALGRPEEAREALRWAAADCAGGE